MSRHGVHRQPRGWVAVTGGIAAVAAMAAAVAATGLALSALVALLFT